MSTPEELGQVLRLERQPGPSRRLAAIHTRVQPYADSATSGRIELKESP